MQYYREKLYQPKIKMNNYFDSHIKKRLFGDKLIDHFRSLESCFVYNDISLNSKLFTYLYSDSLDNYAQQSGIYLHCLIR